jgi:6-phosphogluconate dehydrogenase
VILGDAGSLDILYAPATLGGGQDGNRYGRVGKNGGVHGRLGLHQIAEIWQYGSVVRSWLLDLTERALAEDEELKDIKAWVPDSGEGRWTVFEAIDQNLDAPIITLSLLRRIRSREEEPFSDRLVAALRNQFGGHPLRKKE